MAWWRRGVCRSGRLFRRSGPGFAGIGTVTTYRSRRSSPRCKLAFRAPPSSVSSLSLGDGLDGRSARSFQDVDHHPGRPPTASGCPHAARGKRTRYPLKAADAACLNFADGGLDICRKCIGGFPFSVHCPLAAVPQAGVAEPYSTRSGGGEATLGERMMVVAPSNLAVGFTVAFDTECYEIELVVVPTIGAGDKVVCCRCSG